VIEDVVAQSREWSAVTDPSRGPQAPFLQDSRAISAVSRGLDVLEGILQALDVLVVERE